MLLYSLVIKKLGAKLRFEHGTAGENKYGPNPVVCRRLLAGGGSTTVTTVGSGPGRSRSRLTKGFMRVQVVACVSGFLAMASGCGSSMLTRVDIGRGWSAYAEANAKPKPAEAPAAGGTVLVGSEALFVDLAAPVKGVMRGAVYDLAPVPAPPPGKDRLGYLLEDAGTALAQAIERSVPGKVRLAGEAPRGGGNVVVTARLGVNSDADNTLTVFLHAQLADGSSVEAKGTSESRSLAPHLGWIVPLVVVSGFVPALLWGPPTVTGLRNNVMRTSFSEAADRAGSALAVQFRNASR